MEYDADIPPDPDAWRAADEGERIAAVSRFHRGRFPDALHNEGANEILHASLHQIVETQIVGNSPPEVRQALERLTGAGLRRHAAIHAVMKVLAVGLGALSADGSRFDNEDYARKVAALTAGDALGEALKTADFAERPNPAPNRAARRAAKKRSRKRGKRPPKK